MTEQKDQKKAGSKTNLNESTVPLLDQDNPEKIELKDVNGEEKDDSKTEKQEGDETTETKPKKSRTPRIRGPPALTTLTAGLSLIDRDDKSLNHHVNIQFDDVIAEPESAHSFDFAWRLSYLIFTGTRTWVYRFLALFLAFPCAICWGVSFAFLAVGHVWFISPVLRVFELVLFIFRKIWTALIHAFLDPIFASCGQCFANFSKHNHPHVVTTA